MSNKYIKNLVIASLMYIGVVFGLWLLGFSLAKNSSDYLNQHTMFIDYLRQNFKYSHDFFPQWLMNYGLGQSFVTLFYYGMYNPFILPFYLVPNLNPAYVFEIIGWVIIVLNTVGMTKLLELNDVDDRLAGVIAIMSSFSGVILFHIVTHPMFIYYIPIFTLSLVALHYLASTKLRAPYVISVSLIFYTNFTFAPVISILQFGYYLFLVIESDKLNVKSLINYFGTYILGVLLGALALLPTVFFVTETASRSAEKNIEFHIFNDLNRIVTGVSSNHYISGIFIVGIVGLIGTLIYVKNRRYKSIAILLLVLLVFEPINIFLNSLEYVHSKVYIMFVPLLWLLFAKVLEATTKKQKLALFSGSFAIYLIYAPHKDMILYVILLFLTFMIFSLCFIQFKRHQIILVIPTFVFLSFVGSADLTKNEYLGVYTNSRGPDNGSEMEPYRVTHHKQNYIDNLTEMTPILYTSLENGSYINTVKHEYESTDGSFERRVFPDTFDNPYYQNMFGITNEQFTVNPIVFGVANQDIYSLEEYQGLDKHEKLYAANQGVYISDSTNSKYINNFDIQTIYESNKTIAVDKGYETTVDIPEQYQNGIMTITFDANLEQDDTQLQRVWINDMVNYIQYKDLYGVIDNSKVTFIVNTSDLQQLDIMVKRVKGEPIEYSNLKVEYQTLADFENNKLDVVEPENYTVDLNNSMDFDLDMVNDGVLATTIPYDPGFTITVDGQEVDVLKVDDLYIGANLTAGNHHIQIAYQIPGFKLSLAITGVAMIVTVGLAILDIRNYKKRR